MAAAPDEEPTLIEVRRNRALLGAVGVLAALFALVYLQRATGDPTVLNWLATVALGLMAAGYLAGFVDSRLPLLVADQQGVRIRLGRSWRGIPWSALRRVEHTPRQGLWRDGRLVLVPHDDEGVLDGLDLRGRRQVWLARRLYDAPLAVPLGLSTTVTGGTAELSDRLARLAGDDTSTAVEAPPSPASRRSDRDDDAPGSDAGRRPGSGPEPEPKADPEPGGDRALVTASATPAPSRPLRIAQRAGLTVGAMLLERAPEKPEREAAAPPELEEPSVRPAANPLIGPALARSRHRHSLTLDELADRTRIRPHVIEAIEVDDFAPCGGDFYARGHLRTMARVLGEDAAPLLALYDEHYARAPISARRVFEAELAAGGGGPIRGTRGGLNWSVLVAALMAVVLAWSVARLVFDGREGIAPAPGLDQGSVGVGADRTVPVVVRAAGGGAHVVVKDGDGKVALSDDLAFGESRTVEVVPPARVEASDGSIEVVVDGEEQGRLGTTGEPASGTF